MSPRPHIAVILTALMLAGCLVVPGDGPQVAADPVKVTQVHIETFSDGSEVVQGTAGTFSHLVADVTVPAG
ncbi:MAG: hypothetical protein GWN18_02000, partial [Thermoplasmata archaeon]|nr:hypothetical protein [Thermoplasmata archaeon]NIS10783.1 hypothetical protein [Thermoplasmata archaeon]NIS18721.1 hypothetical protein [Thermoplasmata archaeon]NIU47882.1 hypothetical protein [Thermoplasmata archaeon]NIV77530.1 hypothetical protein [Thermoplasmata archaeon]